MNEMFSIIRTVFVALFAVEGMNVVTFLLHQCLVFPHCLNRGEAQVAPFEGALNPVSHVLLSQLR